MSYILAVGNVTWDVIQQVEHYPQENEEMRASEQWQDSGGNAANTLRCWLTIVTVVTLQA